VELDEDTIAAVKTSGLIGDRYIELIPGGSGIALEAGDFIFDTQSALDLESLIGKFGLGDMTNDNQ
jgi:phospholipid/cholesterol/gamma-HCH transport system substrate-binding protein